MDQIGSSGTRPLHGRSQMIGSTARGPQRNYFGDWGEAAQFLCASDAHVLKNNDARAIVMNDPQPYPQEAVDIAVTIR